MRRRKVLAKSCKCFSLRNTCWTLGQTTSDAEVASNECNAERQLSSMRRSVRRLGVSVSGTRTVAVLYSCWVRRTLACVWCHTVGRVWHVPKSFWNSLSSVRYEVVSPTHAPRVHERLSDHWQSTVHIQRRTRGSNLTGVASKRQTLDRVWRASIGEPDASVFTPNG